MHEGFARVAASRPDAAALVWGDTTLTYRELNARANRLAAVLRRRGIRRETLVGLCLTRSPTQLVAILAVLKAGGAYLPIDSSYPRERVDFMVNDARPLVMITESAATSTLGCDWPDAIRLDAEADEISRASDLDVPGDTGPDSLAYAIYTSGSTGRPKAVLVTHHNVERLFSASRDWFEFGPDDTWTQQHSYAFGYSVWEIWGALLHGARLVMVDTETSASPRRLRQLIARERVTVMCQTPSVFRQVTLGDGFDDEAPPPALRLVMLSGEAVVTADAARFVNHCGPRPSLVSLYALTEAGGEVGCLRLTPQRLASGAVNTVGEIWPDTPVRLIDGELYVGGAGLARGYLHRPELTAERFVTLDGERFYRTGDRARRTAANELELLGRVDDQVKVRGMRVELGEVETVLREHPAVRDVAAALRGDRLIAYVVGDTDGLRAYAMSRLPEPMVPSLFVPLDHLPLNNSGKLDRAALPEPVGRIERANAWVAPRNDSERRLQTIWSTLLGVPVGIHDNYFELGGHSLQAVELFAKIRREYNLDLPLATLLAAPTVAQLAERLGGPPRSLRSLVSIRPGGTRPAIFCVHGAAGYALNFKAVARHLDSEQPIYGLQAVGIDGDQPPLDDIDALAARYLDEIASVQRRGPYHLAGVSVGGLIALEMAHRLRRRGEQVGALILVDPARRRLPLLVRAAAALSLVREGRFARAGSVLIARARDEIRWWVRARRDQKVEQANRVRKALVRAMQRYSPRPYDGPITLIHSHFGDEMAESYHRAWRHLALGRFEIHSMPGGQQCLLLSQAEQLGQIIGAAIASAA